MMNITTLTEHYSFSATDLQRSLEALKELQELVNVLHHLKELRECHMHH